MTNLITRMVIMEIVWSFYGQTMVNQITSQEIVCSFHGENMIDLIKLLVRRLSVVLWRKHDKSNY